MGPAIPALAGRFEAELEATASTTVKAVAEAGSDSVAFIEATLEFARRAAALPEPQRSQAMAEVRAWAAAEAIRLALMHAVDGSLLNFEIWMQLLSPSLGRGFSWTKWS